MPQGQREPAVLVDSPGPVRVVRLNRPARHNAIDEAAASLLRRAILDFGNDDAALVLVVTGSGTSFCSGADLGEIDGLFRRSTEDGTPPLGFSDLEPGKPRIAGVEGHCLGGGLELALWCDFAIAGDRATFGAVNRRFGVPWLDGGTQRLVRRVGTGHALYLLETGETIPAATALAMGLVQEVTKTGGAYARAMALAERMAAYPQRSLGADRRSSLEALGLPLEVGLRAEAQNGRAAAFDPELAAGVSRFLDRGG